MKLFKLKLIFIFLSLWACRRECESKVKISDIFNNVSLSIWESLTNSEINKLKDGRLLFLKNAEKNEAISIFDRKNFFYFIHSNYSSLSQEYFSRIFLIEINNSGEVNTKNKYLLLVSKNRTQIVRFSSILGQWKIINKHFDESEKVIKVIDHFDSIKGIPRNANNIDEIFAISEFLAKGDIKIKIFSALDASQYKSLKFLKP